MTERCNFLQKKFGIKEKVPIFAARLRNEHSSSERKTSSLKIIERQAA